MGKATITTGGTDGLYTVTMDYGKKARDDNVVRIIARMGAIAQSLIDIQAIVDGKQALEDAAKAATEAATEAFVAASAAVPIAFDALKAAEEALADLTGSLPPVAQQTDEQKADLAAASAALSAANAAYIAAQAAIKTTLDAYTKAATQLVTAKAVTAEVALTLEFVKAEQTQLEKDLTYWQNLVVEETRDLWCADLTEDATGVIATLEIPGENALVVIGPGAVAHVPATHGYLTAREVQTPEQVFFNAAILPGWQKFRPTYRRGTITAVNETADTADVTLEATDKSSAQQLVINQAPTLTAVPVQYMACNAKAFKAGDRCVVKFMDQDWGRPKVVGFVDHPKFCPFELVYSYPDSSALPVSLHIQKIKEKEDILSVTAPSVHGVDDPQQWWGWDDGVMTPERHDTTARSSKYAAAQYLSMHKLYLAVQTFDTPGGSTVSLALLQISNSGTFSPFGYYSHEILTKSFGSHAEALAWRPSPVEVHRWVPALHRTFVMIYTYDAGIERWMPPADFASGSFPGQDYPAWPPPPPPPP